MRGNNIYLQKYCVYYIYILEKSTGDLTVCPGNPKDLSEIFEEKGRSSGLVKASFQTFQKKVMNHGKIPFWGN